MPEAIRENNYKDANGRYHLSGLKHWHIQIVDYLLVNPSATNKDIAKFFNVHPQWVGSVRNADAFQEYYAKRMETHQSFVSEELVSKMQGLASRALDKMVEKIDADAVSVSQLQTAADMSLKALGYGAKPVTINSTGSGTVNVMSVSSETLEAARAKMHARRKANSEALGQNPADYQHVTAALDISPGDVEDAVEVPRNDS